MASGGAMYTSNKINTVEDGGSWARFHMALDGVSYIIAFYLVDAFTFGPPQLKAASPGQSSREAAQASDDIPSSPRKKASSSSSPIRRSASEGAAVFPTTPKHHQPYHHPALRSTKIHSESQVDYLKHLYASSQSPTSPVSSASSSSLSPSGGEKDGRSHKEDYFTNRSLHHNQKKLFSRQVERTLRIQPLVRSVLVMTFLALCFLVYVNLFGTPGFVLLLLQILFQSSRTVFAKLGDALLWSWLPFLLPSTTSTTPV